MPIMSSPTKTSKEDPVWIAQAEFLQATVRHNSGQAVACLHFGKFGNNVEFGQYYNAVITLRTKLSGAVYCYRSCLWMGVFVCGSVTTITRNCVHHLHQTGFVGEGSDHLQLIKFWLSCTPGKGFCGRAKIFGSALLQPACSVCISPSTFFV